MTRRRGPKIAAVVSAAALIAGVGSASAATASSGGASVGSAIHATGPSRVAVKAGAAEPVDPHTARPRVGAAPAGATSGGTWSFLGAQPIADEVNFAGNDGPLRGSSSATATKQDWHQNSGRITSMVVNPTNPSIVLAGAADGGVWRSVDGGTSWHAETDNQPNEAIGSMAIDTTGQVIFAGTGEDNFNADAAPGDGILRSTNGGTSWTLEDPTGFNGHVISGLAIDRSTSGATTHVFLTSDLGLWESTNEGRTWQHNANFQSALPAGASGAAFQVIQDPSNPADFWASTGDLCGTEPAEVLLSTTHGATWRAVLNVTGQRIGLAVGTSGTAYAAVSSCKGRFGGIKKTTTYGASWANTAAHPIDYFDPTGDPTGQGWYDNVAAVDPTNNNVAVFGGVTVVTTTDGGSTWNDAGAVYHGGAIHPDFHAIAFSAANTFYIGNDGGVWSTPDLGGTWTDLNNGLGITQFYRGSAIDLSNIVGGSQDNSAVGYLGKQTKSWTMYGGGGDGTDAAISPALGTPTTVYASSQFGSITQSTSTAPTPGTNVSACAGCPSVGFVNPFVMDPNNPKRLLTGGGGGIFESRVGSTYTGGVAPTGNPSGWSGISPVLLGSTADWFNDLEVGGAGESGVIYAASAAGSIWRTTNANEALLLPHGNATWTNITGDLLAAGNPWGGQPFVSSIAFNPWNIDEAWVTTSYIGPGVGTVWHTTNAQDGAGTTWTDISGNLTNVPAFGLAVDPRNPKNLYIGTNTGVELCTTCTGASAAASWSQFGTALPHTWVYDLTFTRDHSSLVAWTHGRGAWAISVPDVSHPTPITEYTEASGGNPQGMVAGPDGPWFADAASGSVGHVNADGTVTSYVVGAGSDGIENVTLGSDGKIYYTAVFGNYVGVVSPDGTGIQQWPIPDSGAGPKGITTGPDQQIWLVESTSDIIDQFNILTDTFGVRAGTVTHNSHPEFITAGSDGNLWFTEFTGLKIAKITTAGVVTEYSAPHLSGDIFGPFGIGLGADGKVYFGNLEDDSVTAVTPTDATKLYGLGAGHQQGPAGITPGPDGNVYVADANAQDLIARIDPTTGTVTDFAVPTAGADPWGIAQGPDGNVWFAEASTGKVGMLQLSQT